MEHVASYYIRSMKLNQQLATTSGLQIPHDLTKLSEECSKHIENQCENSDMCFDQFILSDIEKLLVDVVMSFHENVLIINQKYNLYSSLINNNNIIKNINLSILLPY